MKQFSLISTVLMSLFGISACTNIDETKPAKSSDVMEVVIPEGDTLGNVHYITPEKTQRAAALIKKGQSLPLGRISAADTPAWGDRTYQVEVFKLDPASPESISATDDKVTTFMGIGTQIDGFAHVGFGGTHYNGYRLEDFYDPSGVKFFGMEDVPPIVTRGILLNIAAYKGVEYLSAGEPISVEDIEGALQQRNLSIEAGDVVLLHTGWHSQAEGDKDIYINKNPGIDGAAAHYLGELNVVAVGADTGSLEVNPPRAGEVKNIGHITLLKNHGVYILENIATEILVENDVDEFMFVLGTPRLKGTIQGIINPVAIH